jgi:hypothetical protein
VEYQEKRKQTDWLRKELEKEPDSHGTYHQKKKIIRSMRKPLAPIQDDYQIMTISEQVVIFRLRTGNNRLRGHMYAELKISNSCVLVDRHFTLQSTYY